MSTSKSTNKVHRIPRWLHGAVVWGVLILVMLLTAVVKIVSTESTSLRNLFLTSVVVLPLLSGISIGGFLFLSLSRFDHHRVSEERATVVLEQLMPELDPLPIPQPNIKPVLTLPIWFICGMFLPLQQLVLGIVIVLLVPQALIASIGMLMVWIIPLATLFTLVPCWGMFRRYVTRSWQLFDEARLIPLLERVALEFFINVLLIGMMVGLIHLMRLIIDFELLAVLVASFVWVKVVQWIALVRLVVPYAWIMHPFQQLDFEQALTRSRRFRDVIRPLEAVILAETGQTDQAQVRLFEILQACRSRNRVDAYEPVWLSYYGVVAHLSGRYEDAITALEVVAELIPTDADTHAMLAEACLLSQTNIERALELTQTALQLRRKFRPLKSMADHYTILEIPALHAWARVANGEYEQARKLADETLSKAKQLPLRQSAGIQLRVGRVLALLGDPDSSKYFVQSAEIDPHGWAGRMARLDKRQLA